MIFLYFYIFYFVFAIAYNPMTGKAYQPTAELKPTSQKRDVIDNSVNNRDEEMRVFPAPLYIRLRYKLLKEY